MVMAAGSVMNDPSSGPIVRIVSHHAAGVRPPSPATLRSARSASPMIGRVDASAPAVPVSPMGSREMASMVYTGGGPCAAAILEATRAADGATTGRLQVPAGVGGSNAIDEDLSGTWTLSGTTVTFTPSASSLLTDVDFAVGPSTLTGEGIYQGAVLLLVLTKDE